MIIIKLNAIDSTNDFLKQMMLNSVVEDFTVVTAESQSKGRGQMGNKWVSEEGKNIIASVLIKEISFDNNSIFTLNAAIALAICSVLKLNNIPNIFIKWPNDIMSGNKKVCGILIENSIKTDGFFDSIVGFGINVNQLNFENLPSASSLKLISGIEFSRENLLSEILIEFQKLIFLIKAGLHDEIWAEYQKKLFKINQLSVFQDNESKKFMGIVKGVSSQGRLEVLLENDKMKSFGIKEIQLLYK